MSDEATNSECHAENRSSNVSPAQEWLLATNPGDCRYHDRFSSIERLDWVVCSFSGRSGQAKRDMRLTHVDQDSVCTGGHDIVVVTSPQLPESWKCRNPHPDLKVLVLGQVGKPSLFGVSIGVLLSPVRRWDSF